MIRLRHAIEASLGHPLLGPLLLLGLAVLLGLVALHAVEHGLAGELFTCAILLVAGVRLAVVVGRTVRLRRAASRVAGRSPPGRAAPLLRVSPPPAALLAIPLRR